MLIWVGWGRDWSSLGHAGGGDKPQHCLAHLSPGGYSSVEGVLVLDSLRCPVWMKTDPSRVLLAFLWEGAGKILKLWAISETSQTHSFRSPNNVGISMDINRAWGGWGSGDYLKKKVIWVVKFLWEVKNVGCPTVRRPMPMAIPEGIPTCWVSHLTRSPASPGSPKWYLPSLCRTDPFSTNTMWARYICFKLLADHIKQVELF